jgi:hypothetical protein
MALSTRARFALNRVLEHVNLQVETRTAADRERRRLNTLAVGGHFANPVFPILPAFLEMRPDSLMRSVQSFRLRFRDFVETSRNDVGYTFANDYFSSPDAELLYTLLRQHNPQLYIEIGSGNSTMIARQAVIDGSLRTRIIAIDPRPRRNVASLVDEIYLTPVEHVDIAIFKMLRAGDFLFVDSSHHVSVGNDVSRIYLSVLPSLPSGCFVHIHDIFLPYEYPKAWVDNELFDWNEQYMVQLLLSSSDSFKVIWAGYYLQTINPQFSACFDSSELRRAQSLWLLKTR